jgi:hypothetical protein
MPIHSIEFDLNFHPESVENYKFALELLDKIKIKYIKIKGDYAIFHTDTKKDYNIVESLQRGIKIYYI